MPYFAVYLDIKLLRVCAKEPNNSGNISLFA